MLYPVIFIILGFILLTLGAEGLVRAGVSLALRMGVTPLVIGLTIVSMGTGSPELFVSAQASYFGSSGLAIGNIVGSNISNTALILGVAALIYPIKARSQVVRREMPIMIAVTAVLWLMILDGVLSRIDGAILLISSVVYTITIYIFAQRSKSKTIADEFAEGIEKPNKSFFVDGVFLIGGIATLVLGAKVLIDGAVTIARILDISDVIIGLSVIAIGTSLPELATSAMASFRKESDLALGNAIGSNIVNILVVLGISALINPIAAGEIRSLDMVFMLGTGLFLWALLGFRFLLDRFEAALLLIAYAFYIYTLV